MSVDAIISTMISGAWGRGRGGGEGLAQVFVLYFRAFFVFSSFSLVTQQCA